MRNNVKLRGRDDPKLSAIYMPDKVIDAFIVVLF